MCGSLCLENRILWLCCPDSHIRWWDLAKNEKQTRKYCRNKILMARWYASLTVFHLQVSVPHSWWDRQTIKALLEKWDRKHNVCIFFFLNIPCKGGGATLSLNNSVPAHRITSMAWSPTLKEVHQPFPGKNGRQSNQNRWAGHELYSFMVGLSAWTGHEVEQS